MTPTVALIDTRGAADAGGLIAVDTVGPEALLSLWRGYTDPPPRVRSAPRFDATRRISAEIRSDLLVAKTAHAAHRERLGPTGHAGRAGAACVIAPRYTGSVPDVV